MISCLVSKAVFDGSNESVDDWPGAASSSSIAWAMMVYLYTNAGLDEVVMT